ncbi:hypothetical protein [Nocardia sp. NPDC049149]|uniref:hypothetical protein n=1 Tax=Nocardia sp. NPDC049149 TaxID=3364315 RepID=UPI0037181B3D
MSPTVYYEVNGEPVPATECDWVLIAPCGCECGWSLARYSKNEDEAFTRSAAERKRDKKLGYKVIVKRHRDICTDDCTHDPKWGVAPRPQPDGHTWAAKHEGRVLHLVPIVIEKDSSSAYQREPISSRCGRADARTWSTTWFRTKGLVECTACEVEAKRMLAEAGTSS